MKKEAYKVNYLAVWNMVWPYFRTRWMLFTVVLITGFISAGLLIAEPIIYGRIIDLILGSVAENASLDQSIRLIGPFLIAWICLVIIVSIMDALFSYSVWYGTNKAVGDYLKDAFYRMLHLDLKRFSEEKSGSLIRRLGETWGAIFNSVSNGFETFYIAILRLMFGLSFGFFLDWRMGLISLIPIPLTLIVGYVHTRYARNAQDKENKEYEKMDGIFGDAISNISSVKSFVHENILARKASNRYNKANTIQNKVNWYWAGTSSAFGAIFAGGRLILFAAGTVFVIQGSLTLGTMITFLGFVSFIFGSVRMMVSTYPNMVKDMTRMDRMQLLWHEVPTIQNKKNAAKLRNVKGEMIFENVSFKYENTYVIKDIAFEVPAGKVCAIVGESGSGKSTMSKLMLRFMDPTKGSVRIDGQDLRDLTVDSVRKSIGFVMQENMLFHDTILSNIRLARPSASEKEVIAAAKRAQAHDFIKKLPKGYKSKVGERGVKLSGGERQRIALARVFLEDPPILVLDEATSALDSKTERDLQLALKEVMRNRTSIVIAHRLSTVMAADSILVMDKGSIVDQGTHRELIARGGIYKDFWDIQAGGYVTN